MLRSIPFASLCLLFAIFTGCRPADQIEEYSIPKAATPTARKMPTTKGEPAQMLAAMVKQGTKGEDADGDAVWFFKLTGPPQEVAKQSEKFVALLESISFADEEPTWKDPEGWRRSPGGDAGGIRFATVVVPTTEGRPMSLTVTRLPMFGKWDGYVVQNVNRWRRQLGLPPQDLAAMKDDLADEQREGYHVTFVVLRGQQQAGGMSPPFAGGSARPPSSVNTPSSSGTSRSSSIDFEVPPHWKQGRGTAFSTLAFEVVDGEDSLRITVSKAGGSIEANINRWRGQVGLDSLPSDKLNATIEEIPVGDLTGKYVNLVGESQSLLGVIAKDGADTWFIKMTGPSELADHETKNFLSFVKSLKL